MIKLKTIQAAMRAAATRGVDPRNSHVVQAEMLKRHWKMDAGRRRSEARSEAQANRELADSLELHGHTRFKQAG